MIVRSLEDLKAQNRYAEKPGVWTSSRYLLRDDAVGFTMTQTTIAAGTQQVMEYKNHIEANLVIDGLGTVLDLATGDEFELAPGVMYTLDKHDRHELRAQTDMRFVCVFAPALTGTETHDADHSYPIL